MEPISARPHMPGYGLRAAGEGTGLLPWSWAVDRLTACRHYWLATVTPDGAPHVMPVWGLWHDGALWFSSSPGSRKARNLHHDPRATATTDDAMEPVVVQGNAAVIREEPVIREFAALVNAKYDAHDPAEFYLSNAVFRLTPIVVIGLMAQDFTGSPTRWTFVPADLA
jgi:PPOX class probable F420-dependent enzyme